MSTADWFRGTPWTIVACAAALMFLGLAGISRADDLAASGDFAARQTVWILLSLPVMAAVTLTPYRPLRWISFPLFALSIVLLCVVYFMPARNGSHRWIPLGVMNLQPSELAKITYILALAHYLPHRENYRRLFGLLPPFLLTFLPLGLILKEPDLGTSMVFLPVLYAMLFAAGARPRHLICIALLGVAASPVVWRGMSAEQRSRVVTLFTQTDDGPAPRGDGYHLHQSKQVLALGGVRGSEFDGQAVNDSRAYHLPAGRTDFVFCLVGERFGLAGAVITLTLYAVLFACGLRIAASTTEPFGRLVAVGVVALLATQTAINTGMTVGLTPITGLTLPLMSYGGSSLLSTSICLGLLINVGVRPGYELRPDPFRFGEGAALELRL